VQLHIVKLPIVLLWGARNARGGERLDAQGSCLMGYSTLNLKVSVSQVQGSCLMGSSNCVKIDSIIPHI
jgi:hypothetical protein